MKIKNGRIVILALMVNFILFTNATAERSKEDFIKLGGKSIECVVEKVGTYNFIVSTAEGEEINFITSEVKFIPATERLIKGDKVRVVYFEPKSASQSVDKKHALLVEFMEKQPRDFLSGTYMCILSLPQYRNGASCYLPKSGKLIRVEGLSSRDSKIGSKIQVKLKAIPARRGNGYIYMVTSSSTQSGPVDDYGVPIDN